MSEYEILMLKLKSLELVQNVSIVGMLACIGDTKELYELKHEVEDATELAIRMIDKAIDK